MTPQKKDLTMVRGDTMYLGVKVLGITQELEMISFGCKLSKRDTEYSFIKTLNDGISALGDYKYRIRVAPEDTAELVNGKYSYDLELKINGDVYTVLMGTLEIIADVTRHERG